MGQRSWSWEWRRMGSRMGLWEKAGRKKLTVELQRELCQRFWRGHLQEEDVAVGRTVRCTYVSLEKLEEAGMLEMSCPTLLGVLGSGVSAHISAHSPWAAANSRGLICGQMRRSRRKAAAAQVRPAFSSPDPSCSVDALEPQAGNCRHAGPSRVPCCAPMKPLCLAALH
nr:uncharacterized protein LOC105734513 isoform X2 [Aotus nancymaae]XP_021530275.1 uncharacterized protein LOC105734513 isoform X2 [Aotus nancymaae]XP_021530276.1 uncharacterized protein LOC105734513 isoform X2 [Aotus nancymaae]XP_021530277.1 uncharacterized protein LOC105734513 isoform X2 [Aotus nancymaae]